MSQSRLKRIRETTLTFVGMEGSHRMLSEDDFQYLLREAQRATDSFKDKELIKKIVNG